MPSGEHIKVSSSKFLIVLSLLLCVTTKEAMNGEKKGRSSFKGQNFPQLAGGSSRKSHYSS